MMMKLLALVLTLLLHHHSLVTAFVQRQQQSYHRSHSFLTRFPATTATTQESKDVKTSIVNLKKVLEREYASFFDPMERDYYSKTVTFDDPLNDLEGVEAYQKNVDMLAARTLLGQVLFSDAGIVLHSIEGGDIKEDGSITDIVTRWTLRMTAKILPWKPTARFSGISIYSVQQGGPKGVQVTHQDDYWDSINLLEGGNYQQVPKGEAIADFLNQLKPENSNAPSAGPELPYQLLRRSKDYEVRQYPSFVGVQVPYTRRDDALSILGSVTRGMNPLAPAVMQVPSNGDSKTMMWPLKFAPPTSGETPPVISPAFQKQVQDNVNDVSIVTIPDQVVAVARFSDASVEPVVRQANSELRQALKRDGIVVPTSTDARVKFCQYDAVYSMGKRRGEVWIELEKGGHPWSSS